MTKKCIQCGKSFTISDSEIKFYESKKLSLPKRCKDCREKNKSSGNTGKPRKTNAPTEYKGYYADNASISELVIAILALIAMLVFIAMKNTPLVLGAAVFSVYSFFTFIYHKANRIYVQEFDTSPYKYTFYDTESMVNHYVKHGRQTDCESMEDYLLKANMVIINKGNLTKTQKKDGDTIFYNPKTREFVVIAKAGYVRTYFIASNKEYYNRQ
jgi:hypothetical protein